MKATFIIIITIILILIILIGTTTLIAWGCKELIKVIGEKGLKGISEEIWYGEEGKLEGETNGTESKQ